MFFFGFSPLFHRYHENIGDFLQYKYNKSIVNALRDGFKRFWWRQLEPEPTPP